MRPGRAMMAGFPELRRNAVGKLWLLRPLLPQIFGGGGVIFCRCRQKAPRGEVADGVLTKSRRLRRSQQWRGGKERLCIGGLVASGGNAKGEALSRWGEGMEECFEYIQCLFCVTGKERSVARALEEKEGVVALFPQKLKPFWKDDGWVEELRPLFPGYIFVYSHRPLPRSILNTESNVLRILSYDGAGKEDNLLERDRRFAQTLLRAGGVVGSLEAVEEDGFIRVNERALQVLNARVLRADKRKRLVKLEMEIMGNMRSVWLAFHLVEKQTP